MRAFRFRELLCMIALFVTNRYYGCGREVESTIFQCSRIGMIGREVDFCDCIVI